MLSDSQFAHPSDEMGTKEKTDGNDPAPDSIEASLTAVSSSEDYLDGDDDAPTQEKKDLEAQKPNSTDKDDNKNKQSDDGTETADRLTYPEDCYSFIALYHPCEKPFFFFIGMIPFLFQIAFLSLVGSSVYDEKWRALGGDDNPENTGLLAHLVPTNASPQVQATQVISALSYVFFEDSTMTDIVTAMEMFPNFSDLFGAKDKKVPGAWQMAVSCILRFVQGVLATLAALMLIISSTSVIEIVLNFTALNFISNLDDCAFNLALKGRFGNELKEEANKIKDGRELPECLQSNHIQKRYWFTVGYFGLFLLTFVATIIGLQFSDKKWMTCIVRVEFQENDLRPFSGCYNMDRAKMDTFRRKVYRKNVTNGSDTNVPAFAYCATEHKWFLLKDGNVLKDGDVSDVCDPRENELAHSAKTDTFDVSTVFDEPWYSSSGSPLDLYFIEFDDKHEDKCALLENGKCDEDFNTFQYRYDGGDCCSATCTRSRCASFEPIKAFAVDNLRGIHFPDCKDPSMKAITIRLENFASSFEQSNLLELYAPSTSNYSEFDLSREPVPSRLTLQCNGKYTLLIDVDARMSNQATTVEVEDGANCTIKAERNVLNENCTSASDCGRENPFWVFDYSIFEGETASETKKIMASSNLVEQEKSSFFRIPECIDRKIRGVLGDQNFYQDETVISAIEWLVADDSGYSDCLADTFALRFELVIFYFSLGDGWSNLVQRTPTCIWGKVTCPDQLDLTELSLGKNTTTSKTMLESIGKLGYVKSLVLADNEFEKIPLEILNLTQLTSLDLRNNKVSSIPDRIVNLTGLTYIDFSGNKIQSIPSEIRTLANLEVLAIRNNDFDEIPTEILNLTQLTYLDLSGNTILSIPPDIANLTGLTHLDLSDNSIPSIPSDIGNLTSLTYIDFSGNKIQSIPSEIRTLANLEVLGIRNNALTSIPTEIGGLTNLPELDLSWNNVSTIPNELGHLVNLTKLDLQNNDISSIPPDIGNLTQLISLDFSSNNISTIPLEIGSLVHVTSLDLSGNNILTIPSQIGNLTRLDYLDLSGNIITSIPADIKSLQQLTALDMSGNAISVIPKEIGSLIQLASLDFSSNNISAIPLEVLGLRNNSLSSIPTAEIRGLTKLQELDVSFNDISTIPPEIGNLSELRVLVLRNNTISTISTEIGSLIQLTSLDLGGNNISTIPSEIGSLQNLTTLDLSGNNLADLPEAIGSLESLTCILLRGNDGLIINGTLRTSITTRSGYKEELEECKLPPNSPTSAPSNTSAPLNRQEVEEVSGMVNNTDATIGRSKKNAPEVVTEPYNKGDWPFVDGTGAL